MIKIILALIAVVLLSHFTEAQTSKKQVAAAPKPAAQKSERTKQ